LTQLGIVEDVVDVLNWITAHGIYVVTSDTEVVAGKYYFEATAVADPSGNPREQNYFEYNATTQKYVLSTDTTVVSGKTYYTIEQVTTTITDPTGYLELNSVDEAVANYVQSHLALTNDGLYVLSDNNGWKVLIKSDGVEIQDDTGAIVADYGANVRLGLTTLGHIILSSSGLEILNGATSIANFGSTVRIGENAQGRLRTEIKPSGMSIVRRTTSTNVELANIGYGSGTAASGTADAPYFTFGERASGSTIGNYSMAEGLNITARGYASHAEGKGTTTSGGESHAEGDSTTASGTGSHAEGYNTTASGTYSHAEGQSTTANNNRAHAEGQSTTASGQYSHAEGHSTTASGYYSHAGGLGTIASQYYQTAIGEYNVNNTSATTGDSWKLFIIGNGTSSSRSDAFNVSFNGNVRMALDTSATSGVDKDLYAAINALGWASAVID
jgi:hypothetical protein